MKKYSKKSDYSYTLGTTLTLELLKTRIKDVIKVYINSKQYQNETLDKIVEICKQNQIEMINNDKVFKLIADKDNCFIIGVFKKYESFIEKNTNQVVLVNVSNGGNLGTIIRTCIGFGINNIALIKPSVDIYDPKVIRASMGALFRIRFQYYNSFEEYQKENEKNNMYPFLLDTHYYLTDIKIKSPYSLIFGNESTGLDPKFKEIGSPIKINQSNKIDSLNLDNAVSIAVYEFTKQSFL